MGSALTLQRFSGSSLRLSRRKLVNLGIAEATVIVKLEALVTSPLTFCYFLLCCVAVTDAAKSWMLQNSLSVPGVIKPVYDNLLPSHQQTCDDYGFTKAFTSENRSKLLGLYIGLIKYMDVPPKRLHKWRTSGRLIEEIKATFEKVPESSRGGYYPWFLENQYVLDGSPDRQREMVTSTVTKAWQFTGGAITDTAEEIEAKLALMPEYERDCHLFYRLVISRWHPGPGLAAWENFGFCVCFDEEEEMELGRQYQMLVREKCTFKEFYAAYESSTLLALFESKGLRTDFRHLDDVLRGSPIQFKAVWSLKSFVLQEEPEGTPILPVTVDYGFMNCTKPSDFAALKNLYKKIFQSPEADAIKLHEAAIGGRLLEYVGTLMKLKQSDSEKFKGLLKNPYPLPAESELDQAVS